MQLALARTMRRPAQSVDGLFVAKGGLMRTQGSFSAGLARAFAILAGVAGVIAGGLQATFGAGFACFDTCPSRQAYLVSFAPDTLRLMAPSLVLGLLSLLVYFGYCAGVGQLRAMALPLLASAVVGVALVIFARARLASLPVSGGGLLAEQALESWQSEWGIALMLVAGGWSALMTQQARVLPAREQGTSVAR